MIAPAIKATSPMYPSRRAPPEKVPYLNFVVPFHQSAATIYLWLYGIFNFCSRVSRSLSDKPE